VGNGITRPRTITHWFVHELRSKRQ
jgi:putative N-acetylmannosamine-6-phosphate epimerase